MQKTRGGGGTVKSQKAVDALSMPTVLSSQRERKRERVRERGTKKVEWREREGVEGKSGRKRGGERDRER